MNYEKYECVEKNESCSICLENFKSEDEICVLECFYNHFYHNSCVVDTMDKCPICRAEIKEMVEARNINIIYKE